MMQIDEDDTTDDIVDHGVASAPDRAVERPARPAARRIAVWAIPDSRPWPTMPTVPSRMAGPYAPGSDGEDLPSDPLLGARVVVIDDSRIDALIVHRILGGIGVGRVDILHDPTAAVDRLLRDPPDVVVLDLHMPVVDGFEVLARIRRGLRADRYLPVLVLTGDRTETARERALDVGADDFLVKPCHETELIQRLRNLLRTGRRLQAAHHDNVELRAELRASTAAVRRVVDEVAQRREYLLDAIAGRSMRSVYQPIVDLRTRTTVGVEALSRFGGPPHRTASDWFDDAGQLGLSVELERAAIEVALDGLRQLPSDMFLSLNASPAGVVSGEVLDAIRDVPGERIVVELTEHAPVRDHGQVRTAVDELRRHGVRIAIDDVGAGYAGLQWIIRLRPDMLKLDLELPRGIDIDPVRRALTTALLEFAAESQATVVAEGIETAGELMTLTQLGVQWGQGYYLGRPAPLTSNG